MSAQIDVQQYTKDRSLVTRPNVDARSSANAVELSALVEVKQVLYQDTYIKPKLIRLQIPTFFSVDIVRFQTT